MNRKHGLERIKEICRTKDARVKELAGQGQKVIGYLCYFAPPEIITAAGMVPYRIMGRLGDDIIEANSYIEPYGCPYIRNCFEQTLKGNLDFLTGLVIPHSCDMAQRIYGIWKYYRKPAYSYLFNVPHQITPWSLDFFERELTFFKESLETYTGREISEPQLADAVRLYNDNRHMVQSLYELRKEQPPRVSGAEMMQILIAGMLIPPEEFNPLLKEIKTEIEARPLRQEHLPRIMFWGSVLDDDILFRLIEGAGSHIVIDDTCIGTRSYFRQIDPSIGLMKGLMQGYFRDFKCPRTDHGSSRERFKYILDLARGYNVDGVIGYILSFCDSHKLDFPDLRDYLKSHGIPMQLIDDDYTLSNIESIKNRVQAFLETLGA